MTCWPSVLQPAALHYKEQINKLNMNEGIGMKQSLNSTDRQGAGTMFSQYNRVHNKLGAALGPGVTRDFVMRRQYDPLTGIVAITSCSVSAPNLLPYTLVVT